MLRMRNYVSLNYEILLESAMDSILRRILIFVVLDFGRHLACIFFLGSRLYLLFLNQTRFNMCVLCQRTVGASFKCIFCENIRKEF